MCSSRYWIIFTITWSFIIFLNVIKFIEQCTLFIIFKFLTFFLVLFDDDIKNESETPNKKLIKATSKLQTKTKLLDNGSIEY